MLVIVANSEDLDQTASSEAVSDLGLPYLPKPYRTFIVLYLNKIFQHIVISPSYL